MKKMVHDWKSVITDLIGRDNFKFSLGLDVWSAADATGHHCLANFDLDSLDLVTPSKHVMPQSRMVLTREDQIIL